jgi:branched-subunit amino acid aminotransferase/4-amino-4-deoxychorismate lyase
MSVFETIAVADGRPLFLKEHLERLGRAARGRGWSEVVVPDSLPEIPQDARATGVVRVYLTAGPGGVGDPLSGSLFALFEPCEVGAGFPPLRVVSSASPYLPGPGGWKTGNYWQNVEALVFARSTGADDALLFNPACALVSASMGNVFVEIEGSWKTPALETGARDGVVRAWVLLNLPVEEALLDADAVADSTACFITNSRIGIRPVGELEGRALRTDVDALQSLYREHVL